MGGGGRPKSKCCKFSSTQPSVSEPKPAGLKFRGIGTLDHFSLAQLGLTRWAGLDPATQRLPGGQRGLPLPGVGTGPGKGLLWTHCVAQNAVPSPGVTQLWPPGNVQGTSWGDN